MSDVLVNDPHQKRRWNMNASYIKECINSHMSMDASDHTPWKHEDLLRHSLKAAAIPILQKCALARVAEKLCKEFNLKLVLDLCTLTDDIIDGTTWLTKIQKEKLKWICAICRDESSREGLLYHEPKASQRNTPWTSHTSTVPMKRDHSDLRVLLTQLNTVPLGVRQATIQRHGK